MVRPYGSVVVVPFDLVDFVFGLGRCHARLRRCKHPPARDRCWPNRFLSRRPLLARNKWRCCRPACRGGPPFFSDTSVHRQYQRKRRSRRGTRAGSIAIYCAQRSGLRLRNRLGQHRSRAGGVYIGVTEHGNVETETKSTRSKGTTTTLPYGRTITTHVPWPTTQRARSRSTWELQDRTTRSVAACAAGNAGMIQGAQMLRLGECDMALAGGGIGKRPHIWNFCRLRQPRRPREARRSHEGLAAVRYGSQRHRGFRGRVLVRIGAV